MESINELISPQIFSQQLVNEANDLITVVDRENFNQKGNPECDALKPSVKYVKPLKETGSSAELNNVMRSLVATTSPTDNRMPAGERDAGSCPVVMVIDDTNHSNLNTGYQLVPHQLQQGNSCRTLPLSLLHQQERSKRLHANSPVDFVGSDISLDGLSVSTLPSQIVAVKQEHKLVIVHRDYEEEHMGTNDGSGTNQSIRSHNSPRLDLDMPNINVSIIDEISSDGCAEEVTLNQHHQQQQQQQHHHHHHHHHHPLHQHNQNHQQYGHRLSAGSELIHSHLHQHPQLHQRDSGHHRETLSVIVQTPDDEEDVDEDEDEDDLDSGGHLLSPVALGVDNALEHSTYQTLTSVNNRISPPGFSPTSYATLTPIQPLPPISTMSDKFAYAGHISGSGSSTGSANDSGVSLNGRINNCGSEATQGNGTSNEDCGSFGSLPLPMASGHQGSLGNLSMSGLSGVQSPYSSYDKLPSMMSPPTHNYVSSPSQGLSGMVGTCDLHTHNSSMASPMPVTEVARGGVLSPQSELHSHSPQLQVNANVQKSLNTGQEHGQENVHIQGQAQSQGDAIMQLMPVVVQKQVICLSPSSGMNDGIVVSDYESSFSAHQHEHELLMAASHASTNSTGRNSQLGVQHSPTLSPHSVSAGSMISMSLHSPASVVALPHINGSVGNLTVGDLPIVVSLSPTPPPGSDGSISISIGEIVQAQGKEHQQQHLLQTNVKNQQDSNESHSNKGLQLANVCNINPQQPQQHLNGFLSKQQSPKLATQSSPKLGAIGTGNANSSSLNRSSGSTNDMEEINTKELAQRISAELKRYSIPQAIFAQRVLCRSQGTLSDLLRNPKPWSKLKSGRETFRRMFKWLQEPEYQRMSALRIAAAQLPQRPAAVGVVPGNTVGMANTTTSSVLAISSTTMDAPHVSSINGSVISGGALASVSSGPGSGVSCRRKEEPHIEQMPQPKKPRLVFTDLQRRTLQAIFKETKRPSKEMQVTIARQLGLEPTTVGNFFMNARRRSMDKWRDDDSKNVRHAQRHQQRSGGEEEEEEPDLEQEHDHEHGHEGNTNHGHYGNSLHTTAMSPLGNFDDDAEMDLELEHHDFLVDEHDDGDEQDDLL